MVAAEVALGVMAVALEAEARFQALQAASMDETALIKRLQARDRQAWESVLGEHGPRLVGYATRVLGDKARAEDVVQGALLNVVRTIDSFEGRCSIRSWLYRAVHNRAIDTLRHESRYGEMSEESPDTGMFGASGKWLEPVADWKQENRLDARRTLVVVREELGRLPTAHREIIVLRESQGLDNAELADALGITVGNARVRLHRARQVLRAAVARRME